MISIRMSSMIALVTNWWTQKAIWNQIDLQAETHWVISQCHLLTEWFEVLIRKWRKFKKLMLTLKELRKWKRTSSIWNKNSWRKEELISNEKFSQFWIQTKRLKMILMNFVKNTQQCQSWKTALILHDIKKAQIRVLKRNKIYSPLKSNKTLGFPEELRKTVIRKSKDQEEFLCLMAYTLMEY